MKIINYKYDGAYSIADNIIMYLDHNEELDSFIQSLHEKDFISLYKFSKQTIFHKFIRFILVEIDSNMRYNFEHNNWVLLDEIDEIKFMFEKYHVNYAPSNIDKDDEEIALSNEVDYKIVFDWLDKNDNAFDDLWGILIEETFHLLFRNRGLMQRFNQLIAGYVCESSDYLKFITSKGYIKRLPVPKWVQKAVFHRDQGRCVFCNSDLTGIFNQLKNKNYDHIVPLAEGGINDPTNIQLSCENCNKQKGKRVIESPNTYVTWW